MSLLHLNMTLKGRATTETLPEVILLQKINPRFKNVLGTQTLKFNVFHFFFLYYSLLLFTLNALEQRHSLTYSD